MLIKKMLKTLLLLVLESSLVISLQGMDQQLDSSFFTPERKPQSQAVHVVTGSGKKAKKNTGKRLVFGTNSPTDLSEQYGYNKSSMSRFLASEYDEEVGTNIVTPHREDKGGSEGTEYDDDDEIGAAFQIMSSVAQYYDSATKYKSFWSQSRIDGECVLCGHYESARDLKTVSCSHNFCTDCLYQVLTDQECPSCKSSLQKVAK